MAVWIVEISMSPPPRHHAWQLGQVEALSLEIAAEVIERSDFEIQTYAVAQYGIFRTHLVQSYGAVATGCTQPCIHWLFLILEVFYEFESEQIAVEDKPALHVLNVDHGMIESKLAFIGRRDRSLGRLWLAVLGTRAPHGWRIWRLLGGDSTSRRLLH